MKRRNFLAASTLSLGAIIQSRAAILLDSSSAQDKNFTQYLDLVGAVSEHLVFLDDQKLLELYEFKSKTLRSLGYRSPNNKFYVVEHQNLTVFPLKLQSQEAGVIDISLLFFKKNVTGNWQYCTTFNGYHLAAISKVVDSLSVNPVRQQMADLILPVLQPAKYLRSGYVETIGGQMDLVVRVGISETVLDFKLRNMMQIWFQRFLLFNTLPQQVLWLNLYPQIIQTL